MKKTGFGSIGSGGRSGFQERFYFFGLPADRAKKDRNACAEFGEKTQKQSIFKALSGTLPVKNISKWYILCFVL